MGVENALYIHRFYRSFRAILLRMSALTPLEVFSNQDCAFSLLDFRRLRQHWQVQVYRVTLEHLFLGHGYRHDFLAA